MNNDNLNDFLLDCHVATADLVSLAESLLRSVKAIEYDTADRCPDGILIKLLAERIKALNEKIGDRL